MRSGSAARSFGSAWSRSPAPIVPGSIGFLRSKLRSALRYVGEWAWYVATFFEMPRDVEGYRLTWKRLFNLYLNRYETRGLKPVLRSFPTRLVIEPTNVCNLRCPYCHTGAGRFGRKPAMLDLERCRKLLDEVGDYLFELEVFNWGEAMLHPGIAEIVAMASAHGISTRINSNFSVPFTEGDAERLAASGLNDLFVSIDGSTQEIYERYRVGGDLAKVIRNCRLLAEAKLRLGRTTPRLTLQFLEFPFNADDADAVRRLAEELDMRLLPFRGAVPEPEWGRRRQWPPWFLMHFPAECPYVFGHPVFTVDGNVAPCRGVFRGSDDFAHVAASPGEDGAPSFRAAWNHERFVRARSLFRKREPSPENKSLPCFDCPTAVLFERWREHSAAGGTANTFDPRMEQSANGSWNYFWERGQKASADSLDTAPMRRVSRAR
jgi:pyruvate-formate lyase-activating enzyme